MEFSTDEAGFGVYVHWPFCAAKCPYCDFNSHVRHRAIDQARYALAFEREIAHQAAIAPGRRVSSIFLGGGTPSLMEPATVGAILESIARHWTVPSDVEISLEANPTSVEATRFRGYRAAGVNRVSLGVQALVDTDLKALGRLHSAEDALKAIAIARDTFPRLSFDLIYARPHQTVEAWQAELRQALMFAVDHLSVYQLTIEPDTPFETLFNAGKLHIPSPDLGRAFYETTVETALAAGLPAYEVSNHARPGAECQHNLVYWRAGEYAGIGPGAHARLGLGKARKAYSTERHPETWLKRVEADGHGMVSEETLDTEAQGDEFLLMGLRLAEGVDPERYARLSGRRLDPDRVAMLIGDGLISQEPDGKLKATFDGWLVLDTLVAELAM
jgi:putative oxygen-independent coproporphyrinogen III oxidase